MARTESDAAATGACEFIPFVDLVCDFVGSIAAFGFESHAAKLTAQSAIDFTSASLAKAKEDEALAQIDTLEGEAFEDEGAASSFAVKAEREEATAIEEKAQAEQEEKEALGLFQKSKEENIMAEDEIGMAEEEEMTSEKEMDKALKHGLGAFGAAMWAGILSTLSLAFFLVRFVVAVLIPGGAAIVGFVPYSMTIASSGRKIASFKEWARNAWVVLPLREVSYFALHCAVFVATMIGFSSQLTIIDQFDVRSR